MFRFRKGFITSVVLAATSLGFSQGSSAAVSWSFSEDSVSLGLSGVSPHVEKIGAVDRLWYSGGPAGTAVADCSDAGSCAAVSANWGTPINDVSFATFGGVKRAYFKKMDPGSGTQAVYSAPCATADCVSIGAATLASEHMKVSTQERAWGVPDAVELPGASGVRIYIVESPTKSSSCPEKVASYTSTDGVNFVKDAGYRFAKDGYVDTEVLRAKTGEWVMIMADGPGCGSHQRLYVSESTDGLSWSSPVVLTGTDKSRLDPTGYETSPGSNIFKIYFAAASGGKSMDYALGRGSMKISAAATSPGTVSTTTAAKIGASCTTVGAKSTVMVAKKTVKVTCKKVKNKLVWSK